MKYKDRCLEYIQWVKDNPTQTNKRVKQAIQRFEEDLNREDLTMNWTQVENFCKFAESLKQTKEQYAGKKIHLYPWQVFIFANMYGWYYKDGRRRFKKCYLQVGRKNGKSLACAIPGLWDILSRNGAEVYTVATKRQQALRCWEDVRGFVEQDQVLSQKCVVTKSTSHINYLNSRIVALGADSKREDGLNPSTIICDELAAMTDMNPVKVLQSGMGMRRNPQIWEITACSEDLYSAGKIEYDYACKVLDGTIKGNECDTFFTMLYGLDEEDDWTDSSQWIKANPMLAHGIISLDYLKERCNEAKNNPVFRGEFITKHCARWQVTAKNWIPMDKWEEIQKVKGEPTSSETYFCACGIDLSKSKDLTAVSFDVYQNGVHHMYHKFYFPEKQLRAKVKTDNELFSYWVEKGFLTPTEGDFIDYSYLYRDILQFNETFKVNEVLYDSWNSSALITQLSNEGFTCVPVPMGIKLSPKLKLYEEAIYKKQLRDQNPVMEWMIRNVELKVDDNGNYAVIKTGGHADAPKRIDGVITSTMAVGRIKELEAAGELDMRTQEEQKQQFLDVLAMFSNK